LKRKGVALQILNLGIDTNTPTGKLMLTMLGGIAEFERDIMLERQKEGVAKAKREGKYMGRKPTVQLQGDAIRKLNAEGKSAAEIAKDLGIHRSGVYRVLDKDADTEARLEGRLKAWKARKGEAA
jgi:DNA invertase Pin-like site-specific DNA recombinase